MQYLLRCTPEQMRHHEVRPGITGLSQVGGRHALPWEQQSALDIKYVDDHDLRMDAAILFRTVQAVLCRESISHGDEDEDDMSEFMGTETPSKVGRGGMTKDVSRDSTMTSRLAAYGWHELTMGGRLRHVPAFESSRPKRSATCSRAASDHQSMSPGHTSAPRSIFARGRLGTDAARVKGRT